MKKRVLSIMLVLTMMLNMMPIRAAASTVEQPVGQKDSVYISIGDDDEFILDAKGNPVAYKEVTLEELSAWFEQEGHSLADYGLEEFVYDADGDGEYELTALYLYIYVHEHILGLDWSTVNVTGGPGSAYLQCGVFGFEDENLRYDLNGAYPVDEVLTEQAGYIVGATADRIVLGDGDFLNVQHYSDWQFYYDPATGFNYFTDEEGEIEHHFTIGVNQELQMGMIRGYSDWTSNGEAAFIEVPDFEVFYGTTYGDPYGESVWTDESGMFTLTFPEEGTWYVWTMGGIGDMGTVVSAPAFATVIVAGEAVEPAEPIQVSVTIADKGNVVMPKNEITAKDRDKNGNITVDEVIFAAHESAYSGGAQAGYSTAVGDYGLYITKLWGDDSGNYGYWLNDASCYSLSDVVEEGDSLVAFIYQNTEVWDSYARFTKESYTGLSEAATKVTLEKAGYDADWNTVFAAHTGATLKLYDSDFAELSADEYSVKDNGDGTYDIIVKNVGNYFVVAYDNVAPIVPAISEIVVTLNPDLVHADAVEALIDAIGTVTAASKNAIETARAAYDSLSEEQKALVENYSTLVEAEERLAVINVDIAAADEVEVLIDAIGVVNIHSGNRIAKAREAYNQLTEEQKTYVENVVTLTTAENAVKALYEAAKDVDHASIYKSTAAYINGLGTPTVGSVGGEWMIIDMARAGYDCPAGYYKNVVEYVKAKINDKEQLHRSKSTDNSRVILGLTAAGYDVSNVDGHNLLMGLTDLEYLKKQGINGPIWALIAFDCYNYEIPTNPDAVTQATRENIIAYILEKQLEDGGWALSGQKADPDMTGMAMQALAPYYNSNTEVKAAVDKAIVCLSESQYENGGFGSVDGTCSESCAQVIVALTALGINPETDERFVKNGMSVVDAMCIFAIEGGGFEHVPNGGLNGMATEQGQYALVAYFRFLEGKTTLYDMTDVTIREQNTENKLEISEEGLTEVPDALKEVGLETPEEVKDKFVEAILEANDEIKEENIKHYDVSMMYSEDGGQTWIEADENHFPEDGKIVIVLPYPEGTDSSYTFVVAHMFTSDAFGKTVGDVEFPVVTNTEEGICFEVTGLSPISVGWSAPGSATQSPDTGDMGYAGLCWSVLIISALGVRAVGCKKKKNTKMVIR